MNTQSSQMPSGANLRYSVAAPDVGVTGTWFPDTGGFPFSSSSTVSALSRMPSRSSTADSWPMPLNQGLQTRAATTRDLVFDAQLNAGPDLSNDFANYSAYELQDCLAGVCPQIDPALELTEEEIPLDDPALTFLHLSEEDGSSDDDKQGPRILPPAPVVPRYNPPAPAPDNSERSSTPADSVGSVGQARPSPAAYLYQKRARSINSGAISPFFEPPKKQSLTAHAPAASPVLSSGSYESGAASLPQAYHLSLTAQGRPVLQNGVQAMSAAVQLQRPDMSLPTSQCPPSPQSSSSPAARICNPHARLQPAPTQSSGTYQSSEVLKHAYMARGTPQTGMESVREGHALSSARMALGQQLHTSSSGLLPSQLSGHASGVLDNSSNRVVERSAENTNLCEPLCHASTLLRQNSMPVGSSSLQMNPQLRLAQAHAMQRAQVASAVRLTQQSSPRCMPAGMEHFSSQQGRVPALSMSSLDNTAWTELAYGGEQVVYGSASHGMTARPDLPGSGYQLTSTQQGSGTPRGMHGTLQESAWLGASDAQQNFAVQGSHVSQPGQHMMPTVSTGWASQNAMLSSGLAPGCPVVALSSPRSQTNFQHTPRGKLSAANLSTDQLLSHVEHDMLQQLLDGPDSDSLLAMSGGVFDEQPIFSSQSAFQWQEMGGNNGTDAAATQPWRGDNDGASSFAKLPTALHTTGHFASPGTSRPQFVPAHQHQLLSTGSYANHMQTSAPLTTSAALHVNAGSSQMYQEQRF